MDSGFARRAMDAALEATVVGSFTSVGYGVRRRLHRWPADPDLSGHVVVLTGGTSGLGAAAAHRIAAAGATVHIVGRDADRAEAVAARAADLPGEIVVHLVDLSDLAAVAALAASFATLPRIDVLAHNAGALLHDYTLSPQGIEVTWATHVLAPVVLTRTLLPVLRATPNSRVLTMASGGMYTQGLDVDSVVMGPDEYDGVVAYARAKRAQVALNQEWAEREPNVLFAALHPGWADTPGVVDSLPAFHRITGPLLRTPDQGADTLVWLAGADPAELGPPEDRSGKFWLDRRPRSTTRVPWARSTAESRHELWDVVQAATAEFVPEG